MSATINPMKHPAPAPPPHLMDAMGAAARDGNTVQAAMLNAEYRKWLADQGYTDRDRWDGA